MLRSRLFNALFYLTTALFLVLGSPLLLAPRAWAMAGLRAHARASLLLMRLVVGTRFEIRGRENLPSGPVLVASKHQSAWETFALIPLFSDPAMVMKAELGRIPLYGWFSRKFEHLLIERDKGAAALKRLMKDARQRAAEGRQIVIFPEGTRQPPGAGPDYKPGAAALYECLDLPCVPVALNSGLYWPRTSPLRYPGTIIVEFLPPLPPGLPRKAFQAELQGAIEAASARLIAEAARSPCPPPIPPTTAAAAAAPAQVQ
ncbi:MAG: lysophospholipid acyltransferase family protein [Hyphomicrobiaceae bacterium]|nr:lysophospholipid acyltransferase family protein [Hyphomicrobiaceae bacterium]